MIVICERTITGSDITVTEGKESDKLPVFAFVRHLLAHPRLDELDNFGLTRATFLSQKKIYLPNDEHHLSSPTSPTCVAKLSNESSFFLYSSASCAFISNCLSYSLALRSASSSRLAN